MFHDFFWSSLEKDSSCHSTYYIIIIIIIIIVGFAIYILSVSQPLVTLTY